LSIDDVVKLTLIDYRYNETRIGFYTSSSIISLRKSMYKVLENPLAEYAALQNESFK